MPRVLRGFPFLLARWFPIIVVLSAGAALRWYGLAWDQGYLFHPDERQILMVASNLQWPASLSELFSPASPLSPHFFSYGSFPIYFLRILGLFAPPTDISGPWTNDFLARWIVFGRGVSGAFDLGTILFAFLLGRRLFDARTGLVAAACLAVTVLNIQLSHFYTVDTLLAFFMMGTLYFAVRMAEGPAQRLSIRNAWLIGSGVFFGLALATKVSALPLLVPIAAASWKAAGGEWKSVGWREQVRLAWRSASKPLVKISLIALAVFAVTQPYAVLDVYQYGSAVVREASAARGWLDFPFTRQYANTVPFVYQIWQSAVWGMGLPLGIFAWVGAATFLVSAARRRDWPSMILLLWAIVYLLTIGLQYVKYPRYLLPLYPVLYLMAARVPLTLRWPQIVPAALLVFVLGSGLIYSLAFVSIYGREHPWLAASRWIYENVKPGSTIVTEQWDDPLPVRLLVAGVTRAGSEYTIEQAPIQEREDSAKVDRLADLISTADVVVLSSSRGYASLTRIADRFPFAARYYERLFDERFGFVLAATFRNDPVLAGVQVVDDPRAGLPFTAPFPLTQGAAQTWNWGFEDESLEVYDHPQPLIFVRNRSVSAVQLRDYILGQAK